MTITARFTLLSLLTFVLLMLFPTLVKAQEYFFQEEFNQERANNTLDPDKWTVYPNAPVGFTTVKEGDGELALRQRFEQLRFPYIISKNKPFPSTDWRMEIKFKYTKVTTWGTGIAFAKDILNNGDDLNPSLFTFYIWNGQDGPGLRLIYNNQIVKSVPIDSNYHIFRLDRINKKYFFYLDGQLVFTSDNTNESLNYIWLGNPILVKVPPHQGWSEFNIDYITVKQYSTEPFLDLPWNYEDGWESFNEAALSITSFFDHEYPLLSSGLDEPLNSNNSIIKFLGLAKKNELYSSHDGYDYAKKAKVHLGDPVLAAAAGKAIYVNSCGACGNMILIDHGNGYQTRYLHLQKDGLITNTPGQVVEVSALQPIGKVGATGNVFPKGEAGAHIHFGVFQDKNGDGSFEDNIPDGVVDPFGWQSNDPDPWENFNFFYNGKNRVGNKSFYLWKNKLDHLDATLTSNGGIFQVGKFVLNFSVAVTQNDLALELVSTPTARPTDSLESIGATLIATAKDSLGNLVTQFQSFYTLIANFSQFDLSKYKPSSISFYSSQDGNNWVKEQTTVDMTNKTAAAQLNHMTHFALMAERVDISPPTTTAVSTGKQGQTNWFSSDVQVTLNAFDNPGGLGVDYTLYKVGNEDWQTYTNPLTFTQEGHYKVEFYSVDQDDNIEDFKSVEFDVDKTIPEAKIFVDQTSQDLVLKAIDQNQTTIQKTNNPKKKDNANYLITDRASNTLALEVKDLDKKDLYMFKLYSLQYNNNPKITQPDNYFNISYISYPKQNQLLIQTQQMEIKKKAKVIIKYDDQKKQSLIINQTTKEYRPGLILLQLKTNKGNLEYSY